MKKFRYRLEPVLTLRNWEEERARTAYSQALRQETRFVEALRAIQARIDADLATWRKEGDATTLPASEHTQRWRHLQALERERNDIAQKLASARRIREQKMKLLIDAHRRVQVLDTLKTRQQQAHIAEARRREERELEEIVTSRFQPDL